MVRAEPDPGRARTGGPHRLQVLPRHREHRGDPLNGVDADLVAAASRFVALDARGPDAAASGWAVRAAGPGGAHPLLGTGLRADAATALLWNGARLHRDGASERVRLLMLALVCAGRPLAPASVDDLVSRAVACGTQVLVDLPAPGPADAADPGTVVLAAAATAAEVAGLAPHEQAVVADLAGCLAVIGPPLPAAGTAAPGADLRAGHALVAGWLAVLLHAAGLEAPVGAAHATAATVAGSASAAGARS